ncbi:hypothetical protein [Catenuloplanes japonicus]|uniref:hypothetical protein n=1 Tax=Catenuloplanes japonicus TaxID=33876 RepID=UPI0012FC358C|nr:hypothetical protein [Catenuloplanes japonicus]
MTGAAADAGGLGDHPIRALAEALQIPGATRVALVAEGSSVPAWSSTPGGPDEPIEGTATVAVVMVQAARELLRLTAGGDVDDVLLTSADYFHVLRLVEKPGRGTEVVHLTLQRSGANLAMARHEFRRAATVYRDGPYALGASPGAAGITVPPSAPLVVGAVAMPEGTGGGVHPRGEHPGAAPSAEAVTIIEAGAAEGDTGAVPDAGEVSEDAVSEAAVSGPVGPESVTPESVASESLASESVVPESVAPESVAPESVAPESVAPEASEPGRDAWEAGESLASAPEPAALSEASASGGSSAGVDDAAFIGFDPAEPFAESSADSVAAPQPMSRSGREESVTEALSAPDSSVGIGPDLSGFTAESFVGIEPGLSGESEAGRAADSELSEGLRPVGEPQASGQAESSASVEAGTTSAESGISVESGLPVAQGLAESGAFVESGLPVAQDVAESGAFVESGSPAAQDVAESGISVESESPAAQGPAAPDTFAPLDSLAVPETPSAHASAGGESFEELWPAAEPRSDGEAAALVEVGERPETLADTPPTGDEPSDSAAPKAEAPERPVPNLPPFFEPAPELPSYDEALEFPSPFAPEAPSPAVRDLPPSELDVPAAALELPASGLDLDLDTLSELDMPVAGVHPEPIPEAVEPPAIGIASVVPTPESGEGLEPPLTPPAQILPDFDAPPVADVPLLPIYHPSAEDGYSQDAYPQDAYPQDAYPQDAYPQDMFPADTGTQNDFPQGGYPAEAYPRNGFPPEAYPPDGYAAYDDVYQGTYDLPTQTVYDTPAEQQPLNPYGVARRPGAALAAQDAEDERALAAEDEAAHAAADAAARAVLEAGYLPGYQEPDAAWPGYVPQDADFPVSEPPPYQPIDGNPSDPPWPGETMTTSGPVGAPSGDTLTFVTSGDGGELLPRRTAGPAPEPDPGLDLPVQPAEGEVPSLFSLLNQPFTNDSPTLDRIMSALRNL